MTPAEYKEFCESTYACPPGTDREEYLRLVLIEELGEVASLFAKAMRDGVDVVCEDCGLTSCGQACGHLRIYGPDAVNRDALLKELGDVMWCAASIWMDVSFKCTWMEKLNKYQDYTLVAVLNEVTLDTYGMFWAQTLCLFLGFSPEEVAQANVEKLKDRVARGTIHGAGDER